MERSKRSLILGAVIIIIFHLVGFTGFQFSETRPLFERLVPMNLLLSLGILVWFHKPKNRNWLAFAVTTTAMGYFIEVLGVQSGIIFGEYAYDSALGPKVWGVPPMIGINWLMLTYAAGIITKSFPLNKIMQILLGACMMVCVDILIEPVAIEYNFWHWEKPEVPVQNYISWGIMAVVLLALFHRVPQKTHNPVAVIFFITQIMFFGAFWISG